MSLQVTNGYCSFTQSGTPSSAAVYAVFIPSAAAALRGTPTQSSVYVRV